MLVRSIRKLCSQNCLSAHLPQNFYHNCQELLSCYYAQCLHCIVNVFYKMGVHVFPRNTNASYISSLQICSWSTHWFKVTFVIPSSWKGEEVRFRWNSNSEALVIFSFFQILRKVKLWVSVQGMGLQK